MSTRAREHRSFMERLRPHRTENGAVAVEAALIFPVLILLVFGMIEFSLLLRDYVTVNSAVRTGARTASSEPRITTMPQDTADSIERAGSAMPKNNIDFIYVYRANDKGYPGANGNTTMTGCPGTNCIKYVWNDAAGRFNDDATGSWNTNTINACPGDPNAQAVGVFMQATHKAITGLFGTSFKVSDRAVMKFEPLRPGSCKP